MKKPNKYLSTHGSSTHGSSTHAVKQLKQEIPQPTSNFKQRLWENTQQPQYIHTETAESSLRNYLIGRLTLATGVCAMLLLIAVQVIQPIIDQQWQQAALDSQYLQQPVLSELTLTSSVYDNILTTK